MTDKIKIAIGKKIYDFIESRGLRVVLVDHDDKDTKRLDWYFNMYREPLTQDSIKRAYELGLAIAKHGDHRKGIDEMVERESASEKDQ